MDTNEAKQLAAQAAVQLLPQTGIIGLGSGSTASIFIDKVAELVRAGRRYQGVPTSEESRHQAEQLGIELLDDQGPWEIDVCVDGADEVSQVLDLIKGGGGCHAREKIVNHASRQNIIIVDESKISEHLGQRWPVPIEVLRFAHLATSRALEKVGQPRLRLRDNTPWITDSGNLIYDLHVGVIHDPASLDATIKAIPGVVDTGLFVGRADIVLVAGKDGVEKLTRVE